MKPIQIKKSTFSLNRFLDYLVDVDCSLLTEHDFYQQVVQAIEYSSGTYVWTADRKLSYTFTWILSIGFTWMWAMVFFISILACKEVSLAIGYNLWTYIEVIFYAAGPFCLMWLAVSLVLLLIWWRMS